MLSVEETTMLSIEEITKFVKNIFHSKGKKLNEEFLAMWIREILHTKATIEDLQKAEIKIIRENIPLVINEVCEIIRSCKPVIALPPRIQCNYCGGKGYVVGIKFDMDKVYTGHHSVLNCICGNTHIPKILTMTENVENDHKTMCKDGYYKVFQSVVEETEYLDKVKKNNWRDIR